MVLAERSSDVRNGKRSRGPSPNGHGSPDSSSEDENGMNIKGFWHICYNGSLDDYLSFACKVLNSAQCYYIQFYHPLET